MIYYNDVKRDLIGYLKQEGLQKGMQHILFMLGAIVLREGFEDKREKDERKENKCATL